MRRLPTLFAFGFLILLLSACFPAEAPEPTLTAIPTLPVVGETRAVSRSAACQSGTFDRSLLVGKIERRYRLHVPRQLIEPVALVITLHGFGGDMAGIETYSGMSEVADRNGFIVVYPQALGSPSGWMLESGPNLDVNFIDQLVDALLDSCPVNPDRVFAAGHSRGGGMANRLACDLDRRINSIAAVAGAFGYWEECSPQAPVPVLAIHGLEDTTVPYLGRPKLPTNPYSTPPLLEWAVQWARRNGCTLTPEKVTLPGQVQVETWGGCKERADVILYSLANVGHEWPTAPLNASQAIWEFFKDH